jgi:hypothetical protein
MKRRQTGRRRSVSRSPTSSAGSGTSTGRRPRRCATTRRFCPGSRSTTPTSSSRTSSRPQAPLASASSSTSAGENPHRGRARRCARLSRRSSAGRRASSSSRVTPSSRSGALDKLSERQHRHERRTGCATYRRPARNRRAPRCSSPTTSSSASSGFTQVGGRGTGLPAEELDAIALVVVGVRGSSESRHRRASIGDPADLILIRCESAAATDMAGAAPPTLEPERNPDEVARLRPENGGGGNRTRVRGRTA